MPQDFQLILIGITIDTFGHELVEVSEMDDHKKVEDLLIEQMTLEKIKVAISAELGRIVLR